MEEWNFFFSKPDEYGRMIRALVSKEFKCVHNLIHLGKGVKKTKLARKSILPSDGPTVKL